jgi:hypothetical protein
MLEGLHQCLLDPRDIHLVQILLIYLIEIGVAQRLYNAKAMP